MILEVLQWALVLSKKSSMITMQLSAHQVLFLKIKTYTPTGPEYYVTILSFVDKDQLEPGCSVLLHNKVCIFLTRKS